MRPSPKRAAIILAGGESSRFGSNKALELLAGKPLVSHVAERLSSTADEILVVIGHREPRSAYEAVLPRSVGIINDGQEGKTPLIGIAAGLQATKSEYAFICACDVPFVNRAVVRLLYDRASGVDAAIPRWNQGHIEPLEAVYRMSSTLAATRETLPLFGSSLKVMIQKLAKVVYVAVEDEIEALDSGLRTFLNVNTREEMEKAEELFGREHSPRG
jgi:molybdopterin-guanine dinucleotide biosynthesis protein A